MRCKLHRERYTLSAETADAVNRAMRRRAAHCRGGDDRGAHPGALRAARRAGARACGALRVDGDLHLSRDSSSGVVSALLTNFHLPQSSLLMLVSAFAGRERVLAAYRHAVRAALSFFQLRGLHVSDSGVSGVAQLELSQS